jgi:hypothetical protein
LILNIFLYETYPCPKLRTTVNCVHGLQNVNEDLRNQIDRWIQIKKGTGVGKISFSLLDSDWSQMIKLKAKHGDLIEIVPFETNLNEVCTKLRLKGDRYKRCRYSEFRNIFKMFNNLLEKVSFNDWYQHFFWEFWFCFINLSNLLIIY